MSKILVIDDEESICETIKIMLEAGGKHEVLVALHAKDGLALAAAKQPDLILLDIVMPDMSGLDVLHLLKSKPRTCLIPVIMLTGVNDPASIDKAMVDYAEEYLLKPFEREPLLAAIEHAITHRIRLGKPE